MSINKHEILGTTARVRQRIRKLTNTPFDPAGILSGLVYREQNYAAQFESKHTLPDNSVANLWKEILTLSENLPLPFWNGIHPKIANAITRHLPVPDNSFWNTPLLPETKAAQKTRVIKTEPHISSEFIQPQLDFFAAHLPKGSLNTIFVTRGNESIWGRVPLASAFAENPHQMSIPPVFNKVAKGFNTLLLTTTESITTPAAWQKAFPKPTGHLNSTMAWMNLHQVGHCMVLPTCWEYMDRNYALVTPLELLKLTKLRLIALNEWFLRYYGFDRKELEPDSTSYLYEIKVIENAIYLLDQTSPDVRQTQQTEENLFWFKGLHMNEIAKQLSVSPDKIWQGIWAMDKYLMSKHHSTPTDGVYNSAIHSTDIGTHPIEEIVVDVIAQARIGALPEEYGYWQEYANLVFSLWDKWEKNQEA